MTGATLYTLYNYIYFYPPFPMKIALITLPLRPEKRIHIH